MKIFESNNRLDIDNIGYTYIWFIDCKTDQSWYKYTSISLMCKLNVVSL